MAISFWHYVAGGLGPFCVKLLPHSAEHGRARVWIWLCTSLPHSAATVSHQTAIQLVSFSGGNNHKSKSSQTIEKLKII